MHLTPPEDGNTHASAGGQALEPWTFERLQAGSTIGRCTDSIGPRDLATWRDIYGASEGPTVPRGLATVLVMRAYLCIVTPRPPGNIHRALAVRLASGLQEGELLTMTVSCADKQLYKHRRNVVFEVVGRDAADRLRLEGRIDMVWAR